MIFLTPALEVTDPIEPVVLKDTLAALGLDTPLGPLLGGREEDQALAEIWLEASRTGDETRDPPSRVMRVLIQRYPGLEETQREAVMRAALRSTVISWRHLWMLWEHAPRRRERIVPALVERLTQALERRPSLRKRLPPWLGSSPERYAAALEQPVHFILGWALRQRVLVEDVATRMGCALNSDMGQRALYTLVTDSPADWWLINEPDHLRAWAERRGLRLVQAVANRQLVELGGHAGGLGRLHLVEGRDPLRAWVEAQLGTPEQRPGLWEPLSARARDVFQGIRVSEEVDRVFAMLEALDKGRRARFWARYREQIRDATLFTASNGVAVGLLVVRNTLVVEIEMPGIDLFLFHAPPRRTALRDILAGRRLSSSHFRGHPDAPLVLGDVTLDFRARHARPGHWESRLRAALARTIQLRG